MKKELYVLAISLALAAPACAADVAVSFNEGEQQAATQLPAVLDLCVAGLTLRNDPAACKNISAALNGLANMVKTAQAKAAGAAKKPEAETGLAAPAAPQDASGAPADTPK